MQYGPTVNYLLRSQFVGVYQFFLSKDLGVYHGFEM